MELKEMILQYREVQALRKSLEAKAKELKEQMEDSLKMAILQEMQDEGVQSVHYPEIGRVVRSTRTHYEIFDKEAFATAMLRSIVTAAQQKRPLSEAMLAQYRPGKEAFEDYLKLFNTTAEASGVRQVDQPELSIRK